MKNKNNIYKNNSQVKLKKTKEIIKYNDEELNSFNYQEALAYDKRTYCEYYISLYLL